MNRPICVSRWGGFPLIPVDRWPILALRWLKCLSVAHGTPAHPRDLEHHQLLANSVIPSLNRWAWAEPRGHSQAELQVNGHTRTDNTALVVSLVLQGLGIARIHDLSALPLIRQGRLVPILKDYFVSPLIPIYAVILQERHRLPKIRACIDYSIHPS